MSGARKIAQNALYLAGTNGLNLGVALVFAGLTSRYFGDPAVYGQMGFVFLLTTFLEAIVRGGISTVLTQRVAQKAENAAAYWWPSLVLHLCFGIFFAGAGTIATWVLTRDAHMVCAVFIASFISTTRLMGESAIGILRGLDRMGPEFRTTAIERTVFMALLLAVMWRFHSHAEAVGIGFLALFAANAVSQSLQTGILLRALWLKLRPGFYIDRVYLNDLVNASRPLWISGLLIALHWRVEIFLLEAFSSKAALGIFFAAYKVPDTVRILPWFLCMAFFPALSRHAHHSTESFQATYVLTFKLLLVTALPITGILIFIARPVVLLLYGAPFAAAVPPLIWMSLAVLPMFLNSLFGYGAVALDKQPLLVRTYLAAVIFHAAAAGFLIPRYGALGASFSFLIGESGLLLLSLLATCRELTPLPFRSFARPCLFVLAFGATMALLYPRSETLAAVAASAIYGAGLLALGIFSQAEISRLRAVWRTPAAKSA